MQVAFDSLPLSRRLIEGTRFSLDELVKRLEIPHKPTHRALDDVKATVGLIRILQTRAHIDADKRRELVKAASPFFEDLRVKLDHWAILDLRPAPLVARSVDDVLRYRYGSKDPSLENLNILIARLERLDDPTQPADNALRHVLDRAALVRNVDALGETPGVRLLTMHQSKGLEFPVVILPGLVEGRLPSYHSVKSGNPEKIEEELRLLYVAVTRARQQLHLSWFERDNKGRGATMCRFLEGMEATDVTPEPTR